MEEITQKHLNVLKKQVKKIDAPSFDLEHWKVETIHLVRRIFGADNFKIKQLQSIDYEAIVAESGYVYSSNLEECKNLAKGILAAFITELKTYGVAEKLPIEVEEEQEVLPENISIKIVDILEMVQYELTGRQYKEVEEIMDKKLGKEEKVEQLSSKIKTFSADAAANILANVLEKIADKRY